MTKSNKIKPPAKPEASRPPVLRFSSTAWAKPLFLRDYGDTEVGGFGISASGNLLHVEDVLLIKQVCSWAHVAFDDNAVADFFDRQVDLGRQPQQFGRIWIHTHPGDSPQPSRTDEETFSRVFGTADWAVMFILAQGGQAYARLRFNVGPTADIKLQVEMEHTRSIACSTVVEWEAEYLANITAATPHAASPTTFNLKKSEP